ncbi:MAG: AIR synthase-related protein, partial [Pseudomonadota bacterium]
PLVSPTKGHLGASLYAREILGLDGEAAGPPPPVDLDVEQKNADFVRELVEQGVAKAVHDLSDGGIACAAAELALGSGIGVTIDAYNMTHNNQENFVLPYKPAQLLNDETPGRFLIAASRDAYSKMNIGKDGYFPAQAVVGTMGGDTVRFTLTEGELVSETPLSRLREAHEGWLPTYMAAVD